MFMAEIGLMRKLSHPYIVRYLGCGVITGTETPGGPKQHFIAVVSTPLPDCSTLSPPMCAVTTAPHAMCCDCYRIYRHVFTRHALTLHAPIAESVRGASAGARCNWLHTPPPRPLAPL